MKKDILIPKVKDVGIAVVPKQEAEVKFWQAYVVNFSTDTLQTVLISSKGFGELEGREKETATMRHFIEEIGPKDFHPFEGMIDDLAALTNEFWLSYYANNKLYDKKFVFVAESISEENFVSIPILKAKGVLIV
ncbi:MAG: hypothetical protein ACPF8V_07770 [Luteibaculum sp.]